MVAMGTNVWINKAQCDDAERLYYEKLSGSVLVRKLFVCPPCKCALRPDNKYIMIKEKLDL